MKKLSVTFASAVLFTTSAMAAEVVIPPSKEAIDAFNECQRKGRDECVWPERRVVVPDDLVVADLSSIDQARVFRQAAPDELVSGSENAALRASIRDADGYRTYRWGILTTQDGSANPFGEYGRDSSNASTTGQESTASGQGGGSTSGGTGGNGGGSGGAGEGGTGTGGNGSGDSSRGGGQCAR